ncbi:hypothetical protein D3C73_781900 [compost metagenome]
MVPPDSVVPRITSSFSLNSKLVALVGFAAVSAYNTGFLFKIILRLSPLLTAVSTISSFTFFMSQLIEASLVSV